MFLPTLHLGIEPTAADNGCCLEKLQRTTAFHLAADDALEVIFYGQYVDGNNFVFVHNEFERAAEGLRFLSFSMEFLPDGDVVEGERPL